MSTIRKVFIRNFVTLILVALVGILAFMLVNLQNTRKQLAVSFISKPLHTISIETKAFFSPIENTLQAAISHGTSGKFSIRDTASVNQYFAPILLQFSQISSMGIADNYGYEHDLIKNSSHVVSRTIGHNADYNTAHWAKLSIPNLSKDSIWSHDSYHDSLSRPWHIGAVENPGTPFWTAPYIFNTHQNWGITVSSTYPDNSAPDSLAILALDLTLSDLFAHTSKVQVSESGFSLILTRDHELVKRPSNLTNLEPYTRALEILRERKEANNEWDPFNFQLDDGIWWAQFSKLTIASGQYFIVGVVSPSREIMADLNRTQNVIYIGMATTILLIIGLFWSHKQISATNILLQAHSKKIKEQNFLVQQKNTDLLASIHYAKKLQNAVLPPEERLMEVIPNSFIIHSPKDVISGDFYWIKGRGRTIYFTVADCTGHGVPGAFMSILGMDLLKVALSNNKALSPAQLLTIVRKELIKRLVSDLEKTKDGMDMSLCSFDKETHILKFAGAFNNLFLVRPKQQTRLLTITTPDGSNSIACRTENHTHQLFLIKGDRFPIGYTLPGQLTRFSEYSLKILPGDTIYLTSDGFADQFGGEKGKKFGQQRFRQLLLDVQSIAIKSQGEEMKRVLQNWKKNEEQVDDICVMGVKLLV